MNKVQNRDNARAPKAQSRQAKPVHSQSPPQNQLMKKMQFMHQAPPQKNDLSVKVDLVADQQIKKEVIDYRVEVERRFENSISNNVYTFPLRRNGRRIEKEESIESDDSSLESLKHVTVYDLNSQNVKKEKQEKHKVVVKQTPDSTSQNYKQKFRMSNNPTINLSSSQKSLRTDLVERTEQHKSPQVYRKLFNLVENSTEMPPNSMKSMKSSINLNEFQDKLKNMLIPKQAPLKEKSQLLQHFLHNKLSDKRVQTSVRLTHSKEPKPKSVERTKEHFSYRVNDESSLIASRRLDNKNISRDQGESVDINSPKMEKKMSYRNILSPSNKTMTDKSKKFKQKHLRKIYNNNLLKMMTPPGPKSGVKSTTSKNDDKENCPQMQTPMNKLYQKAQHDVIHGKNLKTSVEPVKTQEFESITSTINNVPHVEEAHLNYAKNQNLLSSYGSPSTLTTIHSSQSKISQKNSLKPSDIASPCEQFKEKPTLTAKDLTRSLVKKPTVKLDLSKRAQESRDKTSSRKRGMMPKDKLSEILTHNASVLRLSCELPQYSSFVSSSTKRGATKRTQRTPGLTPSASTAKGFMGAGAK